MIAAIGIDSARETSQIARRTPARNSLSARATPGGSSSATSPPSSAAQSDVASRIILKTMNLQAVVEIASRHAAGEDPKLQQLEQLLSGATPHKRDAVVALLVDEWDYRHHTVSKIDETVATSQVRPESLQC